MPIIYPNNLIAQIRSAEPILVKEAEKLARKQYFEPAVAQMNADFESHPVTEEIEGGAGSDNISRTLIGFRRKYSEGKNLFSLIGFTAGSDPLKEIRKRLKTTHEDGPKMSYIRGSQVKNLVFSFLIQAPDEDAIFDATPSPRFNGSISWAQRIEMGGIPGVNQFLNKFGIRKSKSGGGVQVEGILRDASFRTRPYLSQIFGDFIARFKI